LLSAISAGLFVAKVFAVLGDLVNTVPDEFSSHVAPELFGSVARVLTAPGAGAVAVISVTLTPGEDPADVFRRFLPVPARDLGSVPIGRIVFGSWDGEDVVVVCTHPVQWEIHCHGGLIAVNRILLDLESVGIQRVDRDVSASLAPKDVSADVLQTLLQCRTRKTASLALGQLDGRLERLISEFRSESPEVKASALQRIGRWRDVAQHLTTPWRVAFVGAPNAGKSSLINAIAGLQRSIVSSTPGTTRDLVEVDVVIDGWLFRLIDTAGVRAAAQSAIEEIGIENALLAADDCDLLCIVVDVTRPELEPRVLERLSHSDSRICIVENKMDLADSVQQKSPANHEPEASNSVAGSRVDRLQVSAVTSAGLAELLQWIVKSAVPEEPTQETVLPIGSCFGIPLT
jgi:tRNA modification GTPase